MAKNTPKLSLRVPEPPARPGDKADFSHVQIDEAGVVARPDTSVAPSETRELAFRLVRVLDDDGKAVGPWDPKLDAETLNEMGRIRLDAALSEIGVIAKGRAQPTSSRPEKK